MNRYPTRLAILVSVFALALAACAEESGDDAARPQGHGGAPMTSSGAGASTEQSTEHGSGGGLRDAGPGNGGAATASSGAVETSPQSSGSGGGRRGNGGAATTSSSAAQASAQSSGSRGSGVGGGAGGATSGSSVDTSVQSSGAGGRGPVDGGLLDGDVDAGETGDDPLDSPAQCTSKMTWKGSMNQTMRPGEACPNCHTNFHLAGTLYPTGHEPSDCNGVDGLSDGAMVVVTGADGQEVTLYPNTVGNFYTSISIAKPFRAKVVVNGKVRAMQTPQSVDSCNSCHTATGANGAPGRITLPR